jgi:hypothetical protein
MKRKLSHQNPLEHANVYLNNAEELLIEYSSEHYIPRAINDQYEILRELAESFGAEVSGLPERLDMLDKTEEFVVEYRDPAFEMVEKTRERLFDPKIPSSWEDLPDKYSIR